ncbi:MAG: hypothetical protein GXY88_02135 [Tissierellia bacterium]|nr:hypothetical protein [Tissierellia bacterium]
MKSLIQENKEILMENWKGQNTTPPTYLTYMSIKYSIAPTDRINILEGKILDLQTGR